MNNTPKQRPKGDSLVDMLSALKERPDTLGLSELDPAALEIGIKLKRARRNLGWTQSELAKQSGIDQPIISSIERGRGADGPSYRTLRRLTEALGLEIVLEPESSVVAGEAWIKTISDLNTASAIDFVGVESDFHALKLLCRTILSDDEQKKLVDEVRAQLHSMVIQESSAYSEGWLACLSLERSSATTFRFNVPTVCMTYHGHAEVRSAGRAVHGVIEDVYFFGTNPVGWEVANNGDDKLGMMIAPISLGLLGAFDYE